MPERLYVGLGLTFHFAKDEYAATVTHIADGGRAIWFRQDRPVKRTRGLGAAFIFVEDPEAPEFEARLEGGVFVLNVDGHRRPIELGVRRWYSAPLESGADAVQADRGASVREEDQVLTKDDLVKRTEHVFVTRDGRLVVTDLALVTSRRKGFRVNDTKAPAGEAVGFVKTLAAAVKLINKYLDAEAAGVPWPKAVRRLGLP